MRFLQIRKLGSFGIKGSIFRTNFFVELLYQIRLLNALLSSLKACIKSNIFLSRLSDCSYGFHPSHLFAVKSGMSFFRLSVAFISRAS